MALKTSFFSIAVAAFTVLAFVFGVIAEHNKGMSTEIRCECLDILCDVLHRFGHLMFSDNYYPNWDRIRPACERGLLHALVRGTYTPVAALHRSATVLEGILRWNH